MAGLATGILTRLLILLEEAQYPVVWDRIEVWRSVLGEAGPYIELTSEQAGTAQLRVPAGPRNLTGLTLELQVHEQVEVAVTFSGPDPLSAAAQASQITAQGLGLVRASVDGDDLLIETTEPGGRITLRVIGGDAAGVLSLPILEPYSLAFGTTAWPVLTSTMETLVFVDQHGARDYFYKVRYRNSLNAGVSEFSDPFQVSGPGGIGTAHIVRGFANLADLNGAPLRNHEVIVFCSPPFSTVDGFLVAGKSMKARTDDDGHVEFDLPRGISVVVSVAGLGLSRSITVPSDAAVTSIDLFSPSVGTTDSFRVQRVALDYMNRRS